VCPLCSPCHRCLPCARCSRSPLCFSPAVCRDRGHAEQPPAAWRTSRALADFFSSPCWGPAIEIRGRRLPDFLMQVREWDCLPLLCLPSSPLSSFPTQPPSPPPVLGTCIQIPADDSRGFLMQVRGWHLPFSSSLPPLPSPCTRPPPLSPGSPPLPSPSPSPFALPSRSSSPLSLSLSFCGSLSAPSPLLSLSPQTPKTLPRTPAVALPGSFWRPCLRCSPLLKFACRLT